MFGGVFYAVGCFAAAMVLTFLYVMCRPVKARDELRSWRILLGLWIFVMAAPYGYVEVLTRTVGANMQDTVQDAMNQAGVKGDMSFYKVVQIKGDTARVIATATEKADWGGTDRAILAMTLIKTGDKWKTDSYTFVNSDGRNADGFTFPPYY